MHPITLRKGWQIRHAKNILLRFFLNSFLKINHNWQVQKSCYGIMTIMVSIKKSFYLLRGHFGLMLLQSSLDVVGHEEVFQENVIRDEFLHRLTKTGRQETTFEFRRFRLLIDDVVGSDFDVGLKKSKKHSFNVKNCFRSDRKSD